MPTTVIWKVGSITRNFSREEQSDERNMDIMERSFEHVEGLGVGRLKLKTVGRGLGKREKLHGGELLYLSMVIVGS